MSEAETPPPSPPEAEPERKPPFKGGRPPVLKPEEEFGAGPRLKDLDAQIEAELAEAMEGFAAQDVLGDPGEQRKPAATGGEAGKKKARVLRVYGADVFVDVPGGRSQGVLSLEQFPDGPPALGSEVEVHIEGYDPANGLLLVSRQGAAVVADWSSVATGMIVEARVTATNKGGLSVDVNGIRGFMPISQVDLYRVEQPEQFVNQRLRCMVAEVDPSERNLVVSRRALLEKEREEQREKVWQELAEGQVRSGIVRSVREFGAFVDLGGVDGLLHVSELSWTRVDDVSSVVQPGQTIKVIVLRIDPEKRKVSLGLKQLQPSPWDDIQSRYFVGTAVKGKVSRVADFGAFVELEPAVEGLIHISELSPQRVRRVSDIVQAGQEVQVMVLSIDAAQRRISLSLKAAAAAEPVPEEDEEEEVVPAKPPRPRTTPLRGGLGE